MPERIYLLVEGQDNPGLKDPSAELVDGLAVSHKYCMAFAGVKPVPAHQHIRDGESPPQFGLACIVKLEDKERNQEIASRQYGQTKVDRLCRYLVMGPYGTWAALITGVLGISMGYWPLFNTISGDDPLPVTLGLLLAWSVAYTLLFARLFTAVFPRRWAVGSLLGGIFLVVTFLLGGGISYLTNLI